MARKQLNMMDPLGRAHPTTRSEESRELDREWDAASTTSPPASLLP
jgi:hypothetical protein